MNDNILWNKFSEKTPLPNRKITIDLDGYVFESETKILENLTGETMLMANMAQHNEESWFVGMSWFMGSNWYYTT